MTPELLEDIRKRIKLKRLYNKSKCPLDWDRYKTLRNVASSLRRKAVSNYFRITAANAEGQPQEISWPFKHSKKNISWDSIHLKEGDRLVVNKLEVAHIFSAHFSSILKDNDSNGHHNDNFRFISHPCKYLCYTDPLLCGRMFSSFAVYVHLKSNFYLSHLIQKKQLVMIRYRQEHCGMVLMLLLIRYLLLSTKLLTLALCQLLQKGRSL